MGEVAEALSSWFVRCPKGECAAISKSSGGFPIRATPQAIDDVFWDVHWMKMGLADPLAVRTHLVVRSLSRC